MTESPRCAPQTLYVNFGPWGRRRSGMTEVACVCCVLSHVWLSATPRTKARQAPLSVEFSRQEDWSGLPWPPPGSDLACTEAKKSEDGYSSVSLSTFPTTHRCSASREQEKPADGALGTPPLCGRGSERVCPVGLAISGLPCGRSAFSVLGLPDHLRPTAAPAAPWELQALSSALRSDVFTGETT